MRLPVLWLLLVGTPSSKQQAPRVDVPALPENRAWHRTNDCLLTDGYLGVPELSLDKLARCDVYAVHVTAAQEGKATRGNPPRVQVSVDETLRGSAKKDERMFAVIGTDDHCDTKYCRENEKEWPVPAVGDPLVIAGGWNRDHTWFDVAYGGLFPASQSDKVRALARQLAAGRK